MPFLAFLCLILVLALIPPFWPKAWGGDWFCRKGLHSLLWWRGCAWYCTRCGQEVSDER